MEKKENEEEAAAVDMISDLPDSILHHIFSFLNMEEAVRSSVYSKRWRDLWISLPTLNFEYDYDDNCDIPVDKILGLVDKVFILRDASNIQRFRFSCPEIFRNPLSTPVNTWILSALRRNLQELVLETCFEKIMPLPTCLFNSKSLTLLKLVSNDSYNYFVLQIPDSSCLPSLKTMFLESIEFEDEYRVNKFFSNCPILESLTIKDCSFDEINIEISSLSLKHLEIEDIFGATNISSDGSFKLKTPNLISFRCKDYRERKYYLQDISLIKADIDMIQEDEHMPPDDQMKKRMLTFLGACCNVEDLTLSATNLERAKTICFEKVVFRWTNIVNLLRNLTRSVICLTPFSTISSLISTWKKQFEAAFIRKDGEIFPTLNFKYNYDTQDDKILEVIKGLVDKVLILRDFDSHIQRFSFICPQIPLPTCPVNTWIVSALRHNLQELVFEIFFEEKPLPTCVFNSKSLTLLKLVSTYSECYMFLPIPDSACLPSLKTLFLESMEFKDECAINKFFSSCPVLESLTIRDCCFNEIDLKISSLSLKHLVIEISGIPYYPIYGSVKLETPNLISFRCKDHMGTKYYLEDISSLIKADICMVQKDEDNHMPSDDQVKKKQSMFKFLGAFHNVEDLTLSATILEAISYPCFLKSNPTGFRNLRCLVIDASFSGDCISAITCLLKISPTIETLFINRRQIKLGSESDLLHDIVTYQGEVSLPCLLDKLEHVEIRDAIGCGNELKFLEILLKNAKVLKNLVVYTRSEDLVDRSVRMKKFTKLLKFPRASSNITILFI